MKILHIITGLNRGGAEQNLLNLLRNTDYSNFQHYVVSLTDQGDLGKSIKDNKVQLFCLKNNKNGFFFTKFLRFLLSIYKLIAIIKKVKPQVVQTWLHHSDLVGLICCLIIRQKNLIWSIRCSYLNKNFISLKNIILIKFLSFFSKIPKLIIFNSKIGYEAHRQIGYSPKNYKFIYNGVDTNKFKPNNNLTNFYRNKFNLKNKTKVVGYIGKYEKIKDIETFLLTAKKIQQSIEDCHVIMVGPNLDSHNQNLLEKIKKINLKNYKLLGSINNINEIILIFDILLLTSLSEGFPNVLLEAMSSGIPCVSTNVGDVKELLNASDIADIGDYKGLSLRSIKYLKLSTQERDKLITTIRNKIIYKYDVFYISKQYEKTYKDLLKNG